MLAMWIPQYDNVTSTIIYAYVACVPSIAIAVFANNMYQTMPNVITPNHQERADIMTPVGLLVGFAPTIMNIIAGPIRSAYIDKGQEYMAMRIIGLISVILGAICIMFIVKVKERVYELEVAPDIAFADNNVSGSEESAENGASSEVGSSTVFAEANAVASVSSSETCEDVESMPPVASATDATVQVIPAPVKKGNALKDFFGLSATNRYLFCFLH